MTFLLVLPFAHQAEARVFIGGTIGIPAYYPAYPAYAYPGYAYYPSPPPPAYGYYAPPVAYPAPVYQQPYAYPVPAPAPVVGVR